LPRIRPRPPTPPTQQKKDFDEAKISALINKTDVPPPADVSDSPATLGSPKASAAPAAMSLDEQQALIAKITVCYHPPPGASSHNEVRTTVHVTFNQDGTVVGTPVVVEGPTGAFSVTGPEAVVHAILSCGPYKLSPETFESWHEIEFTFDPSKVLPG
jgi:hypothetical protein